MLKRRFVGLLFIMAVTLSAPLAWAENLAVIVSNEFYESYPRVRGAPAINRLDNAFQDAGFEVVMVRNMSGPVTEPAGAELWDRIDRAEKLVVVLSGHFVRTGPVAWLLNTDADIPSGFAVGGSAFPLAPVMEAASRNPGNAVVAVATGDADIDYGPGTFRLDFPSSIPQGVTYIQGSQDLVARFIANDLLMPGRILADAVRDKQRDLRIAGYVPQESFLPRGSRRNNAAADRSYWDRAQRLDTLEAYENYLDRYPSGLFAAQAAARVDALRLTPEDRARLEEDGLGLTRDQRRTIQRNLTILGFDTFGIDGIFGRRTRQAVSQWQATLGLSGSGYLNANQIARLEQAAAIRAQELEAEAERKRLETLRQDREYWRQTGEGSTQDGLRAYLKRYPDGQFSEQAREELDAYERENRRRAQREEREAWDRAVMAGTLESYRAYLGAYPQGRFADEAKARVARLAEPETAPAVVEADKREEDALNLNGITRGLIEGQLAKLGLEPGPADGRFDRDTRRALRRYQRDNGLPVTGYVTRAVIVRLLAAAVQQ